MLKDPKDDVITEREWERAKAEQEHRERMWEKGCASEVPREPQAPSRESIDLLKAVKQLEHELKMIRLKVKS
jgi:hypothetical protein